MVPWGEIGTVLLDMDGTLLDLHFDTHFWLEHVPRRYAEARGLDVPTAKAELYPRLSRIQGTMHWYCLDYWSNELDLDIAGLKREVEHLIATHPHVREFLGAVRQRGHRVVLVTNAHARSLELKMERTGLGAHFDALICAHDIGIPKEDPGFWPRLQRREPFDTAHGLLVDDDPAVLRSARTYGIAHLLAVRRPDSQAPPREVCEFPAIESFRDLLPPERSDAASRSPA
ncbi:MAG: GMP/IMP nucleotidase [Gammaproteobacteria bacterium]|nr:GMP/IMP nucleotidase [Gammaproteobacteria bacterium]NIR82558.1 GMP/IMP nucleotidase [Gammaproteobacteria bacterium]NIR88605.1 GMP/IMP nucleotidase [Gammaproteobacteria bacterium]NIU03699.1 GMP/IMP nucleotidase [Gammaproteobacteria bacterium]NIV51034.1 GMP/IMP nucleotidase [Gammaproteobacteria bacterium]